MSTKITFPLKVVEYQSKRILATYQLPIPRGKYVVTPEEAVRAAEEIGLPVVVKAQVAIAGRGKAGGIVKASTRDEVYKAAQRLIGSTLKGIRVPGVLVEECLPIKREIFLGFTIDRGSRSVACLAAGVGGVDIERAVRERPEELFVMRFERLERFRLYHGIRVARFLGYRGPAAVELGKIAYKMAIAFLQLDAELLESNPLVETTDGRFVMADARIIVDDNALFRQKEVAEIGEAPGAETELERLAREQGLSYVDLDGYVGVVGNGAGLVMATIDLVREAGLPPACFLDIGGGASRERVERGLRLVYSNPRVKAVVMNILGGITRCTEVAEGVLHAQQDPNYKPTFIRLRGTLEEEGRKILQERGISVFMELDELLQAVKAYLRGE